MRRQLATNAAPHAYRVYVCSRVLCARVCLPQVLEKAAEKTACFPAPTALEEDADARTYWLLHDVWES